MLLLSTFAHHLTNPICTHNLASTLTLDITARTKNGHMMKAKLLETWYMRIL
ncbi:hypothetical protein HanIR_Chr13g0634261 [Helianthus annuus]|nr:hypothetical protein HanIR_Chr13g0634261 [Helianthus annuus]